MRQLSALLPYFRRYPRKLAGGIAAILGAVAVGLAAPIVVGRAVDAFMASVSGTALFRYALLLVGITAIQGIFSFTQRLVLVSLSRDIEYDLRNDYFVHLERLSASFFQRSRTGDLMARATNDLQAVRMVCGPAIMYSVNTVFTAAGTLYFMARIHWPLTLLSLGTMPLIALVTQVFGQRIHTLFARVQEQFAELSNRVQENLAGIRVVRSCAIEDSEVESFLALNREYVHRNKVLIRWTSAFHPLLQLLVGIGFAAVLWFGGLQVWRGTISVGEFVSFNFFLSKLVWPMIAIGWVINLVQRGSASLARILEVLSTEPEIVDRPPTLPPRPIRGEVVFRNATFSYPERSELALEAVDFALGAGQTLGIVGRTGAGKSTLLALLPRVIDPAPGTVFIDGVDAHRFELANLRSMMGFVPQETFLFSASVRENIAFGRPEASLEEVEEAARVAGLESDLESFPRGLETLVGERGVTLSGGQKQRVALARAVLRQPRILLLDDCLSAVDAATEEGILGNLRRVFTGRTVLLASHRISAVQQADLVLVLQRGRVLERGRHEQLMATDGLYADLARRQRLEEELAAV